MDNLDLRFGASYFRLGAEYVLDRIEQRMYFIPEKWKEKDDSGAIFNIIKNVCADCRKELYIEKERDI